MKKKLFFLIAFLLLTAPAFAGSTVNPFTGEGQLCLDIYTEDGLTKTYCPQTLKVTNGSLTDNGDGTASLSLSAGAGTVTSVSVVSANGLAGSVATATSTPAITLSTTITGILKGNGTAISAASSGTDYAPATSGTAILKGNGSGGFSNAAAGTDYEVPITFSTGLTRTVDTVTVNTSQNIAKLSNLTSNGFVKTGGGDGTLSVDTASYQTLDATLTALAAYNTNGILTQTAADTFTGRTITGTSSRISLSNGDGVAGNPTIDIDAAYVGQASITTLGTITTGTWNAGGITASAKITGNASLDIKNGATSSGVISIYEDSDDGTNFASFQVPALAANTVYILPADDGNSGDSLTTNGSGTLSWAAGAGSGDITSVGSACTTGACDSITIADGQKIDLSGVTVNTTTEGLFVPTYNASGTLDKQISQDASTDIVYMGNGTNAAAINTLPLSSSGAGTSATRYTAVNSSLVSATETDVNNYRTPRSCVIQNLKATIDVDPGGVGKSWDVTVRDDAAGTTLTCNIANGTTECNDATHRPTVAADSKIAVEWVRNSTAASPGNMVATFECIPN